MNLTTSRLLRGVLAALAVSLQAQTIPKAVLGAGYTASRNATTTLTGTFGQSAAGFALAHNVRANLGFWSAGKRVTTTSDLLPGTFALLSNAPNPFSVTTTIRFTLPVARDVELRVYAENGELAATVGYAHCPAGTNAYTFRASQLPQGVYRYTVSDGATTLTGAMNILR